MVTLMKDLDRVLVFVMGAVIGSFLNVCIYRIPKRQSVVFPRSYCPRCHKPIPWYDNIPVLSYLVLLGRCGSCRKRISPRYLAVEVTTAAVFLFLYMEFGVREKFFAYAFLVSALIIATFIDIRTGEIPDVISLGGAAAGLVAACAFPALFDTTSRLIAAGNSIAGMVAGAGSIYLMGLVGKLAFKKDAMGDGDVTLMALIGSFLGWKLALLVFFVAPFFGALVGIPMRLTQGRETIPYAPYLSLGAVIAVFYGHTILRFLFPGF